MAETLLPVFDVPDSAIRIIVLILALGFPLAVVFSWVFELTPEGIRREKDVEVSAVTKQQTAHKLNWAKLVAAVLAIGLLIADRMVPEPAGTRTPTAASEDSAGDETVPMDEGPDPASIAAVTLAGETEAALKVLDEALRLGVYTGDVPTLIKLHQLELEQAFYFVAIRLPSLRGWLGMEEIHAALSRPEEDHDLLIRRLKRQGDAAGSRASIDELLIALGEYQIPHPAYSFWFDAYRDYRASPEFKRHLRRLGLPEFWQANGFPPMCRPLGEDNFECD